MTYEEIPPLFRATWCLYEAIRRLGFEDDDVSYISGPVVFPNGETHHEPHLTLVLSVKGKQCTFIAGPLDRSFEDARTLLEKIRLELRDRLITEETLDRMWATGPFAKFENFMAVVAVVIGKGIRCPALTSEAQREAVTFVRSGKPN